MPAVSRRRDPLGEGRPSVRAKLVVGLALGCVLASSWSLPALAASSTVSAVVSPVQYATATGSYTSQAFWNGTAYVAAAYNYSGTTYVPIRLVANLLGVAIGFQTPNQILITSPGTPQALAAASGPAPTFAGTAALTIVSDRFLVNGADKTPTGDSFNNGIALVPAALETHGTTYVPIRLVANLLGTQISYAPGALPTISLGSVAQPAVWTNLGPAPIPVGTTANGATSAESGRIEAVAVAPSGEIYIGSASGGVWASTDGGGTWTNLTPTATDLAIGALAIDPTNPEVIYAGTGENDGFQTSTGPTTCYDCFYGNGILKSTNGGQTWTLLGQSVFNGWNLGSIAVDPQDPSVLFAAGSRGLWVSQDGGLTWSQQIKSQAWDIVIVPGSPETLFAGVSGVGIETSTNGGATWTPMTNGLPPAGVDIGSTMLAYAPSNPTTMYASIANGTTGSLVGLYVSTDGGQSWTRTSAPNYFAESTTPPLPSQGNYDNALAVSPTNPNQVYAGGTSLYESLTGGQSWTEVGGYVNNQVIHPDFHALTFDPSGSLFIGNDGGIWEIAGSGVVSDLNTNLSLTQFYQGLSVSSTSGGGWMVLAGSQDNGTMAYFSGQGWQSVAGGDGGWNAIDGQGQDFVEADGSIYLGTAAAAGAVQTSVTVTPPFATVPAFNPDLASVSGTASTLLAASNNLWLTQNGGTSWTKVTSVPSGSGSVSAITVAPSDPTTIYAGWTGGLIMGSTDGGQSWSEVAAGTWNFSCPDTQSGYANYTYDQLDSVNSLAVSPTSPNTLYASIGAGAPLNYPADCAHLLALTVPPSGQAEWQDISGNLPSAVNAILIHGDAIDVATNVGVFTAALGTSFWSPLGSGLPSVQVMDLAAVPTGAVLAATHGLGLWELPAGGTAP